MSADRATQSVGRSARRQAHEAEGVRFIGTRQWLIKALFRVAMSVDVVIFQALCDDMAKPADRVPHFPQQGTSRHD